MSVHGSYIVHRQQDRKAMLDEMGVDDMAALLAEIPAELRLNRPLQIPSPLSEWALESHLRKLADKNASCLTHQNFIGGGVYQHHVPAVVDAICSRGEFLTSYTPYQPEMSQGLLQALAEYQELMATILGLPVVNCSSYDGAVALAEAAKMACRASEASTNSVLISQSIWPQYIEVLQTYLNACDVSMNVVESASVTGRVNLEQLNQELQRVKPAIFLLQSPNKIGVLEDLAAIVEICHHNDVLVGLAYYPLLSGIFETPGFLGVDIVSCEGQSLGLPLMAGGPSLGVLACRKEFCKYMPGRLVGEVADIFGKPAYALVYEDREQHVARERATSNICSNQAWCAVRASVYLSTLGDSGLRKMAKINTTKAHYLAEQLCKLPGISLAFSGPFFNEFTITLPSCAKEFSDYMLAQNIFAGLAQNINETSCYLTIAVTEIKTKAELDFYVSLTKNFLNKRL